MSLISEAFDPTLRSVGQRSPPPQQAKESGEDLKARKGPECSVSAWIHSIFIEFIFHFDFYLCVCMCVSMCACVQVLSKAEAVTLGLLELYLWVIESHQLCMQKTKSGSSARAESVS